MGDAWIVNHGVDTLVLNAYHTNDDSLPIKQELDESLRVQLDAWKKQAQGVHDAYPTSINFNGATLCMQPNGGGQGQWPWMLKSKDITLYISGGQWNGIASVRFNSDYIWSSQGLLYAIRDVQVLLDELFEDEVYLQASQVDLCADVVGWEDIDRLDRYENFINRAKKRAAYSETDWIVQEYSYGRRQTGFSFGKDGKGRGALSCRIYDKTKEIEVSGKEWVPDLWRSRGWDESCGKVWRVEISFKREVLHEMYQEDTRAWGIEDAYTLLDKLPLLWVYAVGQVNGGPDGLPDGWLRCALSNGDKNRSRWPTHPVWKVVQGAFAQFVQVPEQFGKIIRKRHEERSIEKGVESVLGYLTSLAAWAGGELAEEYVDLPMVLDWFRIEGTNYLERVGWDFGSEVQRKRVKLGLQAKS